MANASVVTSANLTPQQLMINADLRDLFRRKDKLEERLATINRMIVENKEEWMRQHNVWGIREEQLRKEVGL